MKDARTTAAFSRRSFAKQVCKSKLDDKTGEPFVAAARAALPPPVLLSVMDLRSRNSSNTSLFLHNVDGGTEVIAVVVAVVVLVVGVARPALSATVGPPAGDTADGIVEIESVGVNLSMDCLDGEEGQRVMPTDRCGIVCFALLLLLAAAGFCCRFFAALMLHCGAVRGETLPRVIVAT